MGCSPTVVRSSRYNVMSRTPKSGRRLVLASISFASRVESGTPRVRTPTRATQPSETAGFLGDLSREPLERLLERRAVHDLAIRHRANLISPHSLAAN